MKNRVELIGHYGSDEVHACSAWTSTSRDITEEKKERIPKLLRMLAENGHLTPFEKSSLHFLVNTDIATHIHILKHRIGISTNAESARYKELKEDKFYVPSDWRPYKALKGSFINFCGTAVDIHHLFWDQILEEYSKLGNELYHRCLEDLQSPLGRKRAKESARFFKNYNSQIQSDIMFNFRSFMHFVKLRHTEHAQKEVYDVADKMINLIKNIEGNPFKYSIEAFNL